MGKKHLDRIDETLRTVQQNLSDINTRMSKIEEHSSSIDKATDKLESLISLQIIPQLVKNQQDITDGLSATRKQMKKYFWIACSILGFSGLFMLIMHGQQFIDFLSKVILK